MWDEGGKEDQGGGGGRGLDRLEGTKDVREEKRRVCGQDFALGRGREESDLMFGQFG